MNRLTRGALIAPLALLVPVVFVAPANAVDVTIRGGSAVGPGDPEGDVVENRNLGIGSYEFLRDGIAMTAPGSGDRSGVYWASNTQEFPDSVDLDWQGTQAGDDLSDQPAVVIYIDVDGTGPVPRDALLHEDIYGEGDLWLPESGSTQAKAASPGDSSGSSFAGPIEEWKSNLERLYPTMTIVQVGVNLSDAPRGGRSEGVLRSVSLGDDEYTFTSDAEPEPEPEPEPPATPRDVNGSSQVDRDGRALEFTFNSQAQPPNSRVASKLRWRVAVVGEGASTFVQGFGETDVWQRTFRRNTGRYTVRLFKNGEQVRQIVIGTNNR